MCFYDFPHELLHWNCDRNENCALKLSNFSPQRPFTSPITVCAVSRVPWSAWYGSEINVLLTVKIAAIIIWTTAMHCCWLANFLTYAYAQHSQYFMNLRDTVPFKTHIHTHTRQLSFWSETERLRAQIKNYKIKKKSNEIPKTIRCICVVCSMCVVETMPIGNR